MCRASGRASTLLLVISRLNSGAAAVNDENLRIVLEAGLADMDQAHRSLNVTCD